MAIVVRRYNQGTGLGLERMTTFYHGILRALITTDFERNLDLCASQRSSEWYATDIMVTSFVVIYSGLGDRSRKVQYLVLSTDSLHVLLQRSTTFAGDLQF